MRDHQWTCCHAAAGRAAISASAAQRPRTTALRLFAHLVLAALMVALAACTARTREPEPYSPLILISLDGYRADYIARGLSPRLAALARDGVHARALHPAFPTLTFPNHYTMVTGLYPDHHGIVHNRMVDPATGKRFVYNDPTLTSDPAWWGGEPIWVSAERQGKHAATVFWPGSDVAIGGMRPEHWLPFDGTMAPAVRVDQALAWLDLPPGQRPDFLTLYFEQVDHAVHEGGPQSAELDAALRSVDAALGRLLDGLQQRGLGDTANLVIVSDHGGTASGPDKVIVLDRVVDLAGIQLMNTGVLAAFAAKPGHAADVERAVLQPHAHMRCWRKSQLPAHMHYGMNARIPPLLCLADDGWQIFTQAFMDQPNRHIARGEHGYDDDDPTMRALFVAHGPAFRRGFAMPEFDNVDIYPLLTRILGVRPAANDGDYRAVAPMLVAP